MDRTLGLTTNNSIEVLGFGINPNLVDIPALKFVIDRRLESGKNSETYTDSCGTLPWP